MNVGTPYPGHSQEPHYHVGIRAKERSRVPRALAHTTATICTPTQESLRTRLARTIHLSRASTRGRVEAKTP